MRKNLLAALVVFLFTVVVLLVISDISNKNTPQVESQYYVIDE